MPGVRPALLVFMALVLVVLTACSGGPTFDPVGSYSGTFYPGGAPESLSAGITSSSSSDTWNISGYVPSTSTTFTGTCAHDTSVDANDLSCSYTYATSSGTVVGDLVGNTWSGTLTEGGDTATFVLTR